MDQKLLKQLLNYDAKTGIFTWLVVLSNRITAGQIAGSTNSKYIKIFIFRKSYFAHRLAWLYMTGEWPENPIDHIDNDPSNNKWNNLREATASQNGMNRAAYGKKSASKGIYLYRGKFVVRLTLGTYRELEKAIEVRDKFFNLFQKDFSHSTIKKAA